jgi:thiamine biosynthesis lipoprotein
MGTMGQIAVYGETAGPAAGLSSSDSARQSAARAIDAAFAELHRYEEELAIGAAESYPLRGAAARAAEEYREATRGAFDARIAVMTKAWRFETPEPRIPSDREIDSALRAHDRGWDFGGIGKGMAADGAADVLRVSGAGSAIVNLGGNIRTIGAPSGREEWRIGVRHPRNPEGTLGEIELSSDHAAATSGDYERFVLAPDGTRLHHILDPMTGRPARRGGVEGRIVSVTIVAATATAADAWSTGAFVLGWPEGFEAVEGNPEIEGVFVIETDSGALVTRTTSGMRFHAAE